MNWISQHSAALEVILSALTVLVWVGYLQLFLSSFWRQRRPAIWIEIGGSAGMKALVYVGNLGFEPLYVVNVFLSATTDDDEIETVVTDREEFTDEELNDPAEPSHQGALNSGQSFCIGSFDELLQRLRRKSGTDFGNDAIRGMRITIVALTAGTGRNFIAARRDYRCNWDGGKLRLSSETLVTTQVRSLRERRALKKRLQQRLLPASRDTVPSGEKSTAKSS